MILYQSNISCINFSLDIFDEDMRVIISLVASKKLPLARSWTRFNAGGCRIWIYCGLVDDFGRSFHEWHEFHEFYQLGRGLFLVVAFAHPQLGVDHGPSQD
jgi:hypothetical protein